MSFNYEQPNEILKLRDKVDFIEQVNCVLSLHSFEAGDKCTFDIYVILPCFFYMAR